MTTTDRLEPQPADGVPRRNVLLAGGVVAGAGLLAACGSGGGSTPSGSAAPAASSAPPNTTPTSGGGASSGAAVLTPTSQVPVGGGAIVSAGDQKIVVTQPAAGTFAAFSAVCPHQGCTCNAVTGGVIVCPCHGSEFAISDGSVQRGPARTGLTPVTVKVQGGNVVTA